MYKNMHFFILLCAFIVLFIETTKCSDGEYELRSIKHKRSVDEVTINVKINGVDKELTLLLSDSFFSGDVWLAKKNIETNKFEYILQEDVMEKVNITFYQDQKSYSSISRMVNDKGLPEFNGIVDADKLIRPLQINSRNRRDLSSKLLPQLYEDDFSKYHTIIKRSSFSSDNLLNNSKGDFNRISVRKRYKMNASNLKMPDVVHPEILVFVDTTLFKAFKSNVVETVAYILTLWNGVDLNYRELESPKVRLSISGIVLCQDQPVPINHFKITDKLLDDFYKFLYEQKQFKLREDYDIGVLMGRDTTFLEGIEGKANIAKACADSAYHETVNSSTIMLDDTKFSGIRIASHELGHLFGASHDGRKSSSYFGGPGSAKCPWEDGYLMSYVKNTTRQFEFSKCAKKTMSYFFSRKNAECLYNNPVSERANKKMLRILPGLYKTLNQQCRMAGFKSAWNVEDDLCLSGVWCVPLKRDKYIFLGKTGPVLEGTPCGLESYCLRGHCVKITKDNIPNNVDTKILFPRPYMDGFGKSSDAQCKELNVDFIASGILNCTLYCIMYNWRGDFSISIRAEDGTSCGIDKDAFCQNGECKKLDSKAMFNVEIPPKKISQNTDSHLSDDLKSKGDNQCQNEGQLAMINESQCLIFCATGNTSHPISYIKATDNFPCQSGFCVKGICKRSKQVDTPDNINKLSFMNHHKKFPDTASLMSTTPISMTPDVYYDYNMTRKMPSSATKVKSFFNNQSDEDRCSSFGRYHVFKVNKCSVICGSGEPEILLNYEDGTICGNNGVCYSGICHTY